jgi:hypothetical protein
MWELRNPSCILFSLMMSVLVEVLRPLLFCVHCALCQLAVQVWGVLELIIRDVLEMLCRNCADRQSRNKGGLLLLLIFCPEENTIKRFLVKCLDKSQYEQDRIK